MTFAEAVKILDMKEPFSDTPLTPDRLIEYLKEDVVMVVERPGSWEGSGMHELLDKHGFFSDW